MRLKLLLSILTIAILASCSAQAQNPLVETDPKESKVPSENEIRSLIYAASSGCLSNRHQERTDRLRSYRPLVMAQLAEMIEERLGDLDVKPSIPMQIGNLLAVAGRVGGKQDAALDVCKRLLVTHPNSRIRYFAADYVGRVATTNERSLLLSFLTDSRAGTRVNALEALAKTLGDKRSLEAIESFLADKETKLSKEDQRKDTSVRAARKSIEAIKAKLARESKESAEDWKQIESHLVEVPPGKLQMMKDALQKIMVMRSALRGETGGSSVQSRSNAKEARQYFEGLKATAYLCIGLESHDSAIQSETLLVLRRSRDLKAIPSIVDLMRTLVTAQEASLSGGEHYVARAALLREGIMTLEVITGKNLADKEKLDDPFDYDVIKRAIENVASENRSRSK